MTNAILYIINPENYFKKIIGILKKELKGETLIYVTTNKPYSNLKNLFKKGGVKGEIFFVDCISKMVLGKSITEEEIEDCIFVESPQSLTSLSIAINESLKHISGKKTLLLDSLSTLLIYNDASTIGRFSNFLINKLNAFDVSVIVLTLESDIDKDIIRKIQSFVDEVKHFERMKI